MPKGGIKANNRKGKFVMRRTYAYTVGALALMLAGLYLWMEFGAVFGVIGGLAAGFAGYKLTKVIEDALYKGVNTVVYSGSRKIAEEALSTALIFDTAAGKEKIMSAFLSKIPEQAKALTFSRAAWICKRVTDDKGDDLMFAVGVTEFQYVNNSNIPATMAQISFQESAGRTKATFNFISHTDYHDGSVTHAKEMAELIGIVKDTFMELDNGCKINEHKK